jgi:polyhydroxybutyrate depolymerase
VVFYIILGGGHAWPGSAFSRSISAITGFTTFQVDATTTMWSFFKRFAL